MRTLVLILVSAFALGCGSDAPDGTDVPGDMDPQQGDATLPSTSGSQNLEQRLDDPRVASLYRQVLDSIAPDNGWDRTRYVQFDWMIDRGDQPPLRRSHRWDIWEGQYRVEAPSADGQMVALFDVDDPTAGERIWIDGERVPDGPRTDSLANSAYSMFINDSYWLLFPFKWADPGVSTSYVGTMEEWGQEYEVVELTFDSVGLTPQNRYRAFIDPDTGMMELWQHFTNASDTEPRFTNRWTDWQRYGPILLSSGREDETGFSRIYFENLDASTDVPDGAFAPPTE